MGPGALPRFEKRSAYSDEAVAAIKLHEAMMKEARLSDVWSSAARAAGSGRDAAARGREVRDGLEARSTATSNVTRAPISAEAAAAAAATAAARSGGGVRVWGALEEREGDGWEAAEGVHWSRRRNTEKEDQERERAARNKLVRGTAYRESVEAVFSDSEVADGGSRRAAAPSSPQMAAGAHSPARTVSPGGKAVGGDCETGVGGGGGVGHGGVTPGKKGKAREEGFAGVLESYQENPPALIPPTALPFSMRLDGSMPSPSRSPTLAGAKYSKREAAVSKVMLAKVPSMWPAEYQHTPPIQSPHFSFSDLKPERSSSLQAGTKRAPHGSQFALDGHGQEEEEDGDAAGGQLFNQNLPRELEEVLATDAGIHMALEHFTKFVKRVEGTAKRGEQQLARRQRQLEALRKTHDVLHER